MIKSWGLVIVLSVFLVQNVYAVPVTTFSNGSFEAVGAAENQALGWQAYTPTGGVGYERVSGDSQEGSYGIRITNNTLTECSGAYQRVELDQTTVRPVLLTAYVRGDGIVPDPSSTLVGGGGAGLYVEIHYREDSAPAEVFWNSISNNGTFGWRQIGFNTLNIYDRDGRQLVTEPIDHIFVVPFLCQASGSATFDNLQIEDFSPASQGAVTIMFDDAEDNTFTAAKPLMDRYQLPGVSAAPSGFVGAAGYMTAAQLLDLQTAGWEVVSHSINHTDMTLMSGAEVDHELSASKQALQSLGLNIDNFAVPFGAYNAEIMARSANHYHSTRAFERGDNPIGLFPFEVKVRQVLNTTTVSEVEDWLATASNNKRWTILSFHRIASAGVDQYYTPTELLERYLGAVVASGLPVVTYEQGLRLFDADTGNDPVIPTPDRMPPVVRITSAPANFTAEPIAVVEFSVTDASPTTSQCQVDAGNFEACTSPVTLATLSDGSHQIVIKATDSHSNVSEEVSTTFTVDTVAPVVAVTTVPVSPTNNATPVIEFTVTDETTTTTECKVDERRDFTPCASPWQLPTLVDGSRRAVIRATDAVGHLSQEVAVNLVIDTQKPVITLNGGSMILTVGDTYTESGAVATDNLATNLVVVVGGDLVNTSVVGNYDVTYNVSDTAGNAALQVTRRVVIVERSPVETTGPVITGGGSSRRRPPAALGGSRDDATLLAPEIIEPNNTSFFAPAIAFASDLGGIDTEALAAVFSEASEAATSTSTEADNADPDLNKNDNLAAAGSALDDLPTSAFWVIPILAILIIGGWWFRRRKV